MTLKVTDNQYGRLSLRQLGFLLHLSTLKKKQRTKWANKNVALYFCRYFRQLLIDFQIFSLAHSANNLQ